MHAPVPNWYYTETDLTVPLTCTQQMLIEGSSKTVAKRKSTYQKQLNFQSYPLNDFRFQFNTEKFYNLDTSYLTCYRRDYVAHIQTCPPKSITEPPDGVFKRKPRNYFIPNVSSPDKFMDDHLVQSADSCKKANFLTGKGTTGKGWLI